jgi:uncharacterized protein
MYQHDVKAKHLSESLDEVVHFCVNRVGVDVNTASPSLLSYVSGLNALTARRLVEHRKEKGGFKNRQELMEVSGFGDATFIQAAGFLRISGGDNPLDSTSIHPESYPIAQQIIQRVDATADELFPKVVRNHKQVQIEAAEKATEEPAEEPAEPDAVAETPPVKDAAPATDTPTTPPPSTPAEATSTPPESTEAPAEAVAANTPDAASPAPVAPSKPASAKPASAKPAQAKPSPEVLAARKKRREIVEKISALDFEVLAKEISAGKLLLTDIVRTMKRPDWDPREKVRKPVFRRGMIKTDDLKPGMQVEAQVVNVVDFGVFVDIGLGESCLVHVSQLSNRFIRDPQVMYAIGDVIHTWISEIEPKKRRVKLTAIRPGTERSGAPRKRKTENSGARKSGGAQTRSGSKPTHSRNQRGKPATKKSWKPKPRKPKPVTPITDEMLKGDKPMTSFSDLMQFVKKKPEDRTDK